jgi:hypothetical protein
MKGVMKARVAIPLVRVVAANSIHYIAQDAIAFNADTHDLTSVKRDVAHWLTSALV